MTASADTVLLIGYGNPGRLDDGLGPALAAALERMELPNLTVAADYQLTVEDAEALSKCDVVIFADAAVGGTEPFYFRRVVPDDAAPGFSTHSISPASVMGLARRLFDARTRGYVLGIRGYEFNEFGERLSERAQANLAAALGFVQQALQEGRFSEVGAEPDRSSDVADAGSNGDKRCTMAST